jgi:VWFA-related protein
MKMKRIAFVSVVILLALQGASAQPNLNFKRITVNWPTVELYFSVGCHGAPAFDMTAQDFRVYENGQEIGDFTLTCPDPDSRCAQSTALVLDASASMSGSGNNGARAAAKNFIQRMDDHEDEAAVIWFNHTVTLAQPMTGDRQMLADVADQLPASGGTAVYDGTYTGLNEVLRNGGNPCRSVIVLADGPDNSSTNTPAQIISLANQNGIHIFTIGLGSSIDMELEMIALLTGGRYYQTPNATQLSAIYAEISDILQDGYQECRITYEGTGCGDGSERRVALQLVGYCGGMDAKAKSYQAPMIPADREDIYMRITSKEAPGDSVVSIALEMHSPVRDLTLHPFSLDLSFDSTRLLLLDATAPFGTLLAQADVQAQQSGGRATIQTLNAVTVDGPGTMCSLWFQRKQPADSSWLPIDPSQVTFTAGCLDARVAGGGIGFSPRVDLDPPGAHFLCEGDSLVITAPPGYVRYAWSTGESTRSITVRESGHFSVSMFDARNNRSESKTVTVIVVPAPQPAITAGGPLQFCPGDSVRLDAGAGFFAYLWSTGDTSRYITVREAGRYRVTVWNYHCGRASDFITVAHFPVPEKPVIIQSGGLLVCDSAASYQWFRDGFRIDGATGRTLPLTVAGSYTVRVRSEHGCEALSDPFVVTSTSVLRDAALTSFELYPDPSDGLLHIDLRAAAPVLFKLHVTNMLGQVLYSIEEPVPMTRLRRQVDLRAAPPGMYLLRVHAGQRLLTRKFLRR